MMIKTNTQNDDDDDGDGDGDDDGDGDGDGGQKWYRPLQLNRHHRGVWEADRAGKFISKSFIYCFILYL